MMDEDFDEEVELEVDNIIEQLKNQHSIIPQEIEPVKNLPKEEVEDFLRNQSARLLEKLGNTIVKQIGVIDHGGATDKEITALSFLTNSFKAVAEVLQKKTLSDEKIQAQKEITQMQIDAKVSTTPNENTGDRISFSREEAMRALAEQALKAKELKEPVIDI